MRIVVNDIAAEYGGAMTILKQFYDFIIKYDTEHEWIFLLSGKYLEETDNIQIRCLPEIKKSRLNKIAFDCIVGRKYINSLHPDVVISLQNIITFGVNCPQIDYVHQSIPFQQIKHFSFMKKEERGNALIQYGIGVLIKHSIRKAAYVAVQTDWMKTAIIKQTGIHSDKVIKVFPQVDLCVINRENLVLDNTEFFYPTNSEVYKNYGLIEKACTLLNKKGVSNFLVSLTLPKGYITNENIECVGRLDRQQMIRNYCGKTLVFPSYIETVGLPLLEARNCGTIILAADTAFSRECLSDYENAYFFDPFNAEQLAALMEDVITKQITVQPISSVIQEKKSWRELFELIYSFEKN